MVNITKEKVLSGISFIKTDIWRIRAKDLSFVKAFSIRMIRIAILVIRGINKDQVMLRASSLTFYSALSIVPLLAMAFGISTGFGLDQLLEQQLMENFPGQEAVMTKLTEMARVMLANTRGSLIAGIGVALLFWTVIRVLANIEGSFNNIWEVKKGRTLDRQCIDYLAVMLIGPILIVVSSSLNVFISTQVTSITREIGMLDMMGPFISFFLKRLPFCLIWVLFTILYIFMPNTKVKFMSGVTAGMVAGAIYQLNQWGYIRFQIGVGSYNAIYGSFAALPLFLIWLQLSWIIVLTGAKVSVLIQNIDIYEFAPDCECISPTFKNLTALYITRLVVKEFKEGRGPIGPSQISAILDMPRSLVNRVVEELVSSGILYEIRLSDKTVPVYQPARAIDDLTVYYVLNALDRNGAEDKDIPIESTATLQQLSDILESFKKQAEASPNNKKLKNL
ncbi:YihY/virulence factor BrkB family protein [Desulfobacterales bacterium HSG16]|nr:YihY/virulence factor BrkB family protein [Desulfobacterales bacterium HSG16]